MDPTQLANELAPFLVPHLPALERAGESAAGAAGKAIGTAAWQQAQALWERLRPKVEARPAAREAASNVAKDPDDTDAQAALRLQLRKLLSDNAGLLAEVNQLWRAAKASDTIDERNVNISGVVHRSTIIIGDRNRVRK